MKKIFLALCLASALSIQAATPTPELTEAADKLQMQCPIDAIPGWVIQTVCADDTSTTITIIVDDSDLMGLNPAAIKQRFARNLSNFPFRRGTLLYETVSSGLQFVADLVSATGLQTVTLTFTPEELEALKK